MINNRSTTKNSKITASNQQTPKLGIKNPTRQILGVALVDIDLRDDVGMVSFTANLPLEIVKHELLIGGVESEPWRESLSADEEIRIHCHLEGCRLPRRERLTRFWEVFRVVLGEKA